MFNRFSSMATVRLQRMAAVGQYRSMGAMKTIQAAPWGVGKIAGAGAIAGIGALCAYGLSRPANFVPAKQRNLIRGFSGPQFAQMVRQRLAKTYGYVAGGLGITAFAATQLFLRGYAARMGGMGMAIGCMVGMMALMIGCQATPQENVLLKHSLWLGFNGMMGFSLCPLVAMGGAVLSQAAMITGAIVGSLSLVAACAPDDQFLSWGPYLGCGLGVVFAASIGSMFFPHVAMLQNVCLYGGLGLFGCFVCYDTQKMKYHAEMDDVYDPINRGFGLYMDTINIFVRVAQILMMNKQRR